MSDGYTTPTHEADASPQDSPQVSPPGSPQTEVPPPPPPPSTTTAATTRSHAARIRAAAAVTMAQDADDAAAAQLRATANAAARKANESWVDNIRAEDGPILEDRMGNSEAWIAETKRQCLYRDCLDTLTNAPTADSSKAEHNGAMSPC